MKITLPLRQFPEGRNEQHQLITGYFSGKEYQLSFSTENVDVILSWPQDSLYYIDPNLQTGLDWWDKNLLVKNMPLAIQKKSNYQLSLNDNWTLFAWANWLKRRTQKQQSIEKVIILHIDDHRDCMSPLLFLQKPGVYLDPLTNKQVTMNKPESILSAIESGAIAVGSFMPVFFHQMPNIEFRHLLPPHRLPTAYKAGEIKNYFEKDDLLCLNCDRPTMMFENHGHNQHIYCPTADLAVFLANIPPDVPVLLHVDMDYFNNRFDGDSDWKSHEFRHDPMAESVLLQVSEVFEATLASVPRKQLEDITVALSPGFFPAEFWKDTISIIDRKFQKINEQQNNP
ncbi:hypothetical protein [Mucilaginibacter sp.]|uniref:hypothetical protein n=1 Tax=Mucilaginibacter sp. TaxID=1882438 RepID=UPI00326484BF